MDGFAVTERLHEGNSEFLELFSKTSFTYQYFDDGSHYLAHGLIIRIDSLGDVQVQQLRFRSLIIGYTHVDCLSIWGN